MVTTDEPSENQIPDYVENQLIGTLAWAPNGQTPKLVYPPGKPGEISKMIKTTTSTVVHITTMCHLTQSVQVTQHTEWLGGNGNFMMTDPNDPARDQNFTKILMTSICTVTRTQA